MPTTSRRQPVLVFDGDCGFCTTSATVAKRLRRHPEDFDVVAYQFADLDDLGLTPQACAEALQYVSASGRIFSAEQAVAQVLRQGRRWVRPVGCLLGLPVLRGLAAVVYRWVARNRYRLPGGTPMCILPQTPPPNSNG